MAQSTSTGVKVWDLFVRISHWTVAIAFFDAYLTEDEALTVHVWVGCLIGVLVILHSWGFAAAPSRIATHLTSLRVSVPDTRRPWSFKPAL